MSDHVRIEDRPGRDGTGRDGGRHVRLIRLDRPAKKNALTGAMYDAMRAALEGADACEAVGAVVFAGADGTFTAGNDLADFVDSAEHVRSFAEMPALQFIRQLARTRTPLVAAVDGLAVGIGATLTLHCDLVYVGPSARFRMPFVELGLVPEAGASHLLPRRIGPARASELLLLGEGYDGAEAVRLGLANTLLPAGAVLDHALAQAARLAALPREALASARALMRGEADLVAAAIEAEAVAFEACLRSPEAQAAIGAFLSRNASAARGPGTP